jgi:hypothetical protein
MNKKIKIFYNDKQNVENVNNFFSSTGNLNQFIEAIKNFDYVEIINNFQKFSKNDFSLSYSKEHIDSILEYKNQNLLTNIKKEVIDFLFWLNTAFHAAAKFALENKTFCCSQITDFHHVIFDECTNIYPLNGFILTAIKLKQQYPDILISIIDINTYYSDRTDNIINKLGLKDFIHYYTFDEVIDSVNKQKSFYDVEVSLKNELNKFTKYCDLILYQVGEDFQYKDQYGRYFTIEELKRRDQIIFEFAKINKIPLVWNFADFYHKNSKKLLEIHLNTLSEAYKWIL